MRTRPVVVITGASSGIGRATAHAFAGAGARLVLAARNADTLREVVGECEARGSEAIAVPTDVSVEQQVKQLAAAAVAEFGRIDVWVGSASVFSYGTFERTPPEIFRQVIETNLMGQVHGARAVLPRFRAQQSGVLVLVGSLFSEVGAPYLSPYVTTKFAVLGFAEVLRQEVRKARDIDVIAVLPGSIDTPIYQHAANYTGRAVHPLPPVSSPERVARAIVRATRHPRPVVVVGRAQRIATVLHGIAPRAYDRFSALAQDAVALRRGGVPASAGNVLEPAAEDGGVRGGWQSRPLRALGIASLAAAGLAAASSVSRAASFSSAASVSGSLPAGSARSPLARRSDMRASRRATPKRRARPAR